MAIAEEKLPTRAPVTAINVSNLSSVDIYAIKEGSTTSQHPWTPTPFALDLTPNGIGDNQIPFSPKLHYSLGGKWVIFYGYCPRTTTTATIDNNYIIAPGNGIAPTYHFTLTSTEDVMYAVSTPTGSTSTSSVNLTFNRMLTRLRLNTSLLGSLSGIKLIGVSNKGMFSIGSGTVTCDNSVTDIALTVPLLRSVTDVIVVPADVTSYKVEIVLLLSLLKWTYLVKPTSGAFQPGAIHTISL